MKNFKMTLLAMVAMAFSTSVLAAVPAEVDTELASIMTDATSLQTSVFPIVIGIAGLAIIIKLAKRFMNKV